MNCPASCLLTALLLAAFSVSAADSDQPRPQRQRRPGSSESSPSSTQPRTTTSSDRDDERPAGNDEDDAQQREAERAAQRLKARLVRGPYLQLATPNSMVVRWRTDLPSGGSVRFGLSETNLKFNARSQGALTEHVVLLTNLAPNTRYYYALSTNVLSATNSSKGTNIVGGTNILFTASTNSFVTPPPEGTLKPTRVWVLGDPGTAKPMQKAVTAGFKKFNGDHPIDLWLMLGDNAYTSGKDSEYQAGVFAAYPEYLRTIPLWPTLGNHDGGSADSPTQSGVYYDLFTLPTQAQAGGSMSGTEAYYSFNYANLHFICLDSHDTDRTTNSPMLRWLKADLAANTQQWTIAYFHHPPYSKASHDTDSTNRDDIASTEMRQVFAPAFDAGGVDLVLCGHSHGYERSWVMDGHYGRSTNFSRSMAKTLGNGRIDGDGPYRKASLTPGSHDGTLYVVAGSSGQISGIKGMHPAMQIVLNIPGSLVLDVNGPRLDATFVDNYGNERDYFTLVRGRGAPSPAPREIAEKAARTGGRKIPERLRAFFNPSNNPPPFASLTNAIPADQELLLTLYTNSQDIVQKQRLTWALATIGNGAVTAQFMGLLTNKIRDRVLSTDEEDLRLITLQSLGLLAQRYEPPMSLFRKGLSADWWYFRTNWVSTRPMHETAARLTASTIRALGHSGRPEATEMLNKARKRYADYEVEEEKFTRDFAPEYDLATNRIAEFPKLGPTRWRQHIITDEFPKVKLE